jgi:superfamily II DNA or RNA helicase
MNDSMKTQAQRGGMTITRSSMLRISSADPAEVAPLIRRWEARARAEHDLPPSVVLVTHKAGSATRPHTWELARGASVAGLRRDVVDATVSRPIKKAVAHKVTLRPYQRRLADAAVRAGSGLLIAPCGAGKTTLGVEVVCRLRERALVLVHTRDLLDQWLERFRASAPGLRVATWEARTGADVVVGMVQTLVKARADQLKGQFGAVLLDEAHHAPAATWGKVLAKVDARHRFGLTATPERLDGLTGLLHLHIGPVVGEVKIAELERTGATLQPEVRFLLTNMGQDDLRRDALIARVAAEEARTGRRVLVLVGRVQQAEQLAVRVSDLGVVAHALHGHVPAQQRKDLLKAARAGNVPVLIGTQLADEGLDVPTLDTVILAAPSNSKGRTQQRIGRGLRPGEKARPVVWDLVDAGHVDSAEKREQLYEGLGWPVTIVRNRWT